MASVQVLRESRHPPSSHVSASGPSLRPLAMQLKGTCTLPYLVRFNLTAATIGRPLYRLTLVGAGAL